uniref:Coiled-coil domain-containing protein 24 isoform X2 n=1 Tax=Geotrypetes seraphini TaxID=260995 RepID=A0A6P8NBH4_GEOSA|nr:coiled-coil domain-containing protein 24 isoform X2 [Geotrypetes seraphini]
MSPDDKDSGFGEVFEPPLSLWKLVEEHVPASERLEIRKILGEHAIDLSLELHREVDTWLKVRHELRSGTFYGDRLPGPSSRPALADPPLIKDMLKEEIRLLLMSVRQRAHSEGRTGSSLEDTLETIKEKLNISSIDEVVAHLRSVLEEECQSLKREIAFLQSFIMREKDYTDLMAPDPTLTELKEERRVIKQDLQLKPWVRSSRPSHKAVLPKNADESIRPVDLMFQSSAAEMFHGGISCSHPDSVSLKNTRGSKVSSCLVGLKFKNHTFKASRASICSGAHGHRPKVIPLKCAPPTSDKARGQEQVAAEVVCVLPGNSGYSAITLDSRTSSNESFQMRASSCPSADSILGQLPHIRLKLSGVKTAIVPTPPSNQRSSFSSSAIAYRKMRCLQSNSAT